jgi:hypothetical protein
MSLVNYGSVATDRYLSAADMALGTEIIPRAPAPPAAVPLAQPRPRDCVKNQHGMHARKHICTCLVQCTNLQEHSTGFQR